MESKLCCTVHMGLRMNNRLILYCSDGAWIHSLYPNSAFNIQLAVHILQSPLRSMPSMLMMRSKVKPTHDTWTNVNQLTTHNADRTSWIQFNLLPFSNGQWPMGNHIFLLSSGKLSNFFVPEIQLEMGHPISSGTQKRLNDPGEERQYAAASGIMNNEQRLSEWREHCHICLVH